MSPPSPWDRRAQRLDSAPNVAAGGGSELPEHWMRHSRVTGPDGPLPEYPWLGPRWILS